MHSAAFHHRTALPFMLAAKPRGLGLAVTLLVHALLIVAWQMARTLPPPAADGDEAMLWLRVPAPAPALAPALSPAPAPASAPAPSMPAVVTAERSTPVRPAPAEPAPLQAALPEPVPDAAPTAAEPVVSSSAAIMDSARRSIGDIDRALRKERQPTIVLPPDSPQIRLRRGIEHAREMAPPRLWEAPRVVELVNNTGDGARRTRVITGNRTYCLTDRAPTTNIEMIEMHGKQRFTTCPKDEEPARQQDWRTARD